MLNLEAPQEGDEEIEQLLKQETIREWLNVHKDPKRVV